MSGQLANEYIGIGFFLRRRTTLKSCFFSAIWACAYNGIRGNLANVIKALKTRSGKYVILAAIIGGPVGMTGYMLSINNMGAAIGAVASAIFPAIGAVLAYFFLKEKCSGTDGFS